MKKTLNTLFFIINLFDIFSPIKFAHIHDLDNNQFKFLKKIAHIKNLNISKDSIMQLKNLVNFDSLQLRHQLINIMFVFDLLKV